MHKILYRPIAVISLVLGMLVMVELLALGSITWRNLHRIDNIKQDIIEGHELEQLVFDLINTPIQTALSSAILHEKISHIFANRQSDENGISALLNEIKSLILNVDQGKNEDIVKVLLVSQKLLNQQRSNEEKLLTQVYQDSRLELNLPFLL